MSFTAITYKCYCTTEATLGVVDGDKGVVYCGTCEGVLGDLEDFYTAPRTQIEVKKIFTYTEYITVQIKDEDGELIECNHAGAESEPMEFVAYTSYDGGAYTAPDDSRTEDTLVCDKCKAWYCELNEEWINV